jgi:glucokinase
MRHYLGWDIGGTKSSALVVSSEGEVLAKETWASESSRGPHEMLGDFLQAADRLGEPARSSEAVGVSVGGPLDPVSGRIFSPPHLPGWDDFPLRQLLEDRLQKSVTVEHDAVACLLAEHLWGAAHRTGDAAYLTAGTGCGAALLNGGRVLRGPGGQTTEIGHLRLADDGPEVYGKRGSVEAFCSGTGIALLASEMFPERFPQPVAVRELARLTAGGNASAREVLDRSARCLGRVCAWLTDLFAPQVIIIGSLATYLPSWWLDAIRAEWEKEALPRHRESAVITASALQNRLQDLSSVAACVFATRS